MSTFAQVARYNSMRDLPKNPKDNFLAIVNDHPFVYKAKDKIWVPIKFNSKLGTDLYSLNKTGFDNRPPLSEEERQELKKNLRKFYAEEFVNTKFFMLLNNKDLHYYTVFYSQPYEQENFPYFEDEVVACLDYLGEILAAEEDDGKFEIWIRPKPETCEESAIALYLFPYDEGVILCR